MRSQGDFFGFLFYWLWTTWFRSLYFQHSFHHQSSMIAWFLSVEITNIRHPCPGLLCIWGSLHPLALPLTPFPCTRRAPDFPGAWTGVPLLPHHTLRWVSVFTLIFSHPGALEWQEVARKGGTHYRKKDTPLPISTVSAILPKVTCLTWNDTKLSSIEAAKI